MITLMVMMCILSAEWKPATVREISPETQEAKQATEYAIRKLLQIDESYQKLELKADSSTAFNRSTAIGDDSEIHFAIMVGDGSPNAKQRISCTVFYDGQNQFQGAAYSDFPTLPTTGGWECNSHGCA
eukprot:TRINITY_DN31311_c0_g1_i1.p1 TRINITY_DN31311_c0_g1~~TRINITY_DN31311_c0_g1_i1.p1  ORF type:complete len:128 (+),score=25.47 TRINITY_DN31311_c0_g1_i1:52-435(+)